ncbi:rhamnulokinase [Gracilibacillus alcaliphilus]|uniref:rhamnulokinase n=1 Tax=Gracilibacillus alcaliphilus TaxID=1401441 RepID=UPI0019560108|nr:rhamnulokinase [Gracilibacillus alcaliphilus]MBM7679306.1 rhamnulokinase [Gracilibacillus alcaliphilus]
MQKCHIAVDIGASSGRLMAGYLKNQRLVLREIHRFDNHMIEQDDQLCWDIDRLFQEIIQGLQGCREQQLQPVTIAIDTWAVDFVLLDRNKRRLTHAVSYRDHRTDGMMEEVFQLIDSAEIYQETGIQFQPFNTIYQLYALKKQDPEVLHQAQYFLMVPDYLHYLLTGKMANEYTNASSTQLLHASTRTWHQDFLAELGLPSELFSEPAQPLQSLGMITKELQQQLGFPLEVVLPATHDTASAVFALPADHAMYISSGTWSLMGVELDEPITTKEALAYNFTNEGGATGTIRFLKNIMGLWMIQRVKKELAESYEYHEFVELAYQVKDFDSIVDANDTRFLNPSNMIAEIQASCRETKQKVPQTAGELAKCIFDSLVESYQQTAVQIEVLAGKQYEAIHIIGGGSKNKYINEKLAEIAGKRIYAGLDEATAIGNVMAQMIATGQVQSVDEGKKIIAESFTIQQFN